MRKPLLTGTTVLLALAVAGCTDAKTPLEPRSIVIPLYVQNTESRNFGTHLSGAEEVPPVNLPGRGKAIFKLSKDGTTLHYKLITSNVTAITQAHIHIAPEGVNGPVVVFLFGFVAGGVNNSGVLAEGDITAANLIPRPAIGFGATMAELLAYMRTGGAYVNVHTVAFPGGQIRGQIEEHGPSN